MNIKQSLKWASDELKQNNVSEPEKSAEFLLRQILASFSCHSRPPLSFPRRRESSDSGRINSGGNPVRNSAWIIANSDYKLDSKQENKFHEFIKRRKKHEPVWYITGKIAFYGLELEVNQNVLIPRPETEFLVEEVLKYLSLSSRAERSGVEGSLKENKGKGFLHSSLREVGRNDKIKILEIGTGSGAISLALANKFRPEDDQPLAEKIFASDISEDALQVAQKNAKTLALEKFIEFRQGDLLVPWQDEKFDIIVANLPYIPHEDMATLALDIHHWEPRLALDGGKDGLEIYEKLISQAKDHLNENSKMFFEIGIDQGDKIKELVEKYLPNAKVKIQKDYGDIDRIAIISNIRNSC